MHKRVKLLLFLSFDEACQGKFVHKKRWVLLYVIIAKIFLLVWSHYNLLNHFKWTENVNNNSQKMIFWAKTFVFKIKLVTEKCNKTSALLALFSFPHEHTVVKVHKTSDVNLSIIVHWNFKTKMVKFIWSKYRNNIAIYMAERSNYEKIRKVYLFISRCLYDTYRSSILRRWWRR